jgi:hypothetical protein
MLRGEARCAAVYDRSRIRLAHGCEAKPIASYVHRTPSPNTPNQSQRLLLAPVEPLRRSAASRLDRRSCSDGLRCAPFHCNATGRFGRSVSVFRSTTRSQEATREVGNRFRPLGTGWRRASGLRRAWHSTSRGTHTQCSRTLIVIPQEGVWSSRFVVRTNRTSQKPLWPEIDSGRSR